MGLDSFTTEGPRTYKKNRRRRKDFDTQRIHLVNGMDERGHDYLKRHEVHKVFMTNQSMEVELPGTGPYFICSDCGKIARSYETMLKTDLVDFIGIEWVDDAKKDLLDEFSEISEDKYHVEGLDAVELQDDDEDEGDDRMPDMPGEGSSSSSDDDEEDFNSGLGSFTS